MALMIRWKDYMIAYIDFYTIIILMHPYIFLLMEFQKPIFYFQETVLNNFKSHLEKIKSW